MTVVALTSARSSPGVTSLAVGLAWALEQVAGSALLVEADPAGGVLALRFGLPAEPSMTTLSADIRRGFDEEVLLRNTVQLGGTATLLGPVQPSVAKQVIERNSQVLAQHLPLAGQPAVVDLGRLGEDSVASPLARAADLVFCVFRPRLDEIQSLLFMVHRLRSAGCSVLLVSVGNGPFEPTEIANHAGLRSVAVLPDDPAVARALVGGRYRGRQFQRSLLWRHIVGLAELALVNEPQAVSSPAERLKSAAKSTPIQASIPAVTKSIELSSVQLSRSREDLGESLPAVNRQADRSFGT